MGNDPMGNEWLVIFTIGWFALWFLFPLGMFYSVHQLDKDTDQLYHVSKLRYKKVSSFSKMRGKILSLLEDRWPWWHETKRRT